MNNFFPLLFFSEKGTNGYKKEKVSFSLESEIWRKEVSEKVNVFYVYPKEVSLFLLTQTLALTYYSLGNTNSLLNADSVDEKTESFSILCMILILSVLVSSCLYSVWKSIS